MPHPDCPQTSGAEPRFVPSPASTVVRLDPATLSVAAALAGGGPGPMTPAVPAHIDALTGCGLAVPGHGRSQAVLRPWFADLVGSLAEPGATVEVHRFVGARVAVARLLITARRAVIVVHNSDASCTLTAVDHEDTATAVARLVKLDPARDANWTDPAAVASIELAGFHERLVSGAGPASAAVLSSSAGLKPHELSLVLGLVSGRCSSWRVVAARATLLAIDAGDRGLWCAAYETGGAQDTGLVRISGEALFAAMAGILVEQRAVASTPATERAPTQTEAKSTAA